MLSWTLCSSASHSWWPRASFGRSRKEGRKVEGVLAAHSITTIWYLVAAVRTRTFARETVSLLARVFGIAAVDESVIKRALGLGLPDFEDAVCAAAAEAAACDLLVTRNVKDYRDSPVTAVDLMTALALIEGRGGPRGVSERRGAYRRRGRPAKQRNAARVRSRVHSG
jgi:predicted nucleic acid-binding protein